MILITVFYQP